MLAGCAVILVCLKSVRNIAAPPTVIALDSKEMSFAFPTRFKSEVSSRIAPFSFYYFRLSKNTSLNELKPNEKKVLFRKSHNVRYAKTKQLLLMNEILKPHADKCGVGSSRALYANKSVTTWYSCRDNHFYHNRNHELQWLQSLFAYTYTWINLHTHHNNNKHWIDRQTTSMTKIEAYFFFFLLLVCFAEYMFIGRGLVYCMLRPIISDEYNVEYVWMVYTFLCCVS